MMSVYGFTQSDAERIRRSVLISERSRSSAPQHHRVLSSDGGGYAEYTGFFKCYVTKEGEIYTLHCVNGANESDTDCGAIMRGGNMEHVPAASIPLTAGNASVFAVLTYAIDSQTFTSEIIVKYDGNTPTPAPWMRNWYYRIAQIVDFEAVQVYQGSDLTVTNRWV